MMNTLQDALQEALDKKKCDYSKFVWKGKKEFGKDKQNLQSSKLMIDMTEEELKACYAQCNSMLNSTNIKNLGRYNVQKEIIEQITKCNVELLLRWLENSYRRNETRKPITRYTLNMTLRAWMNNNSHVSNWNEITIDNVANNLPEEFRSVSISDVLDGCMDTLGAFNKQHLTLTFLINMGIWFTKSEKNELEGDSNNDRLKITKERLHLPSKPSLRFSDKGLSFHELRAMLTLPKRQKYSDMTTVQLEVLKNKVLPRFQREVDGHIYNWNRLKKQIELVAKSKGFNLND